MPYPKRSSTSFVVIVAVALCACAADGTARSAGPGGAPPPPDDWMSAPRGVPPAAPPATGAPVLRELIGPGATADAPARFAAASPVGQPPVLVYPADGVIVPPNLVELEIQFHPGAGNTQFEITFWSPALLLRVYVGCAPVGSGCGYVPDETVWSAVASAARGREPIQYQIRGIDERGASVGSSAVQRMELAEEDLTGGIYYWNAAAGTVMRYDFGLRGQRAETYLDQGRTGATECVGCHAMSRDGSRIAVGLDEPIPSRMAVYDVGTRRELFSLPGEFGGANFFSFSPDSTQMVVSDGATIRLLDTITGRDLATMAGITGTMPDWSPDGRRIVFAEMPAGECELDPSFEDDEELPCVFPTVRSAQISTIDYVDGAWRRGPVLVPSAGDNNFYPSFSPDGQWVLFNRSSSNRLSYDSEGDETARDHELWIVSASGGAPIRLDNARSGVGDAWPKWDPTPHQHRGEPIFWLSFASTRPYGLRSPSGGPSQIWMAAFVPSRAAAGLDPVTAPVWLPFQESTSGNHIAQWVSRVERQGCADSNECGAGEFCSEGRCLPDLI